MHLLNKNLIENSQRLVSGRIYTSLQKARKYILKKKQFTKGKGL